MASAAITEAQMDYNEGNAKQIQKQFERILKDIDERNKDPSHPALTKARDQLEQEKQKFSDLCTCIRAMILTDERIGIKLDEMSRFIISSKSPPPHYFLDLSEAVYQHV